MKRLISVLSLAILWPLTASWGQLRPPNAAGVSLGHWHTIVRDVDAAKKFWITLGGEPIQVDGTEVVKFPGVLVFLTSGTPSGGNEGAVVGHVGFGVQSVQNAFAKWKAAGVKTSEIGKSILNGQDYGHVYGPENLKIEITEEAGVFPYPRLPPNVPIESNVVEFYMPESSRKELQDWYVKMFGIIPGELGPNLTGVLPGAQFIRIAKFPNLPMPTKGRTLDHIGFEVKNLEAFCKKLEGSGVKIEKPLSRSRHKSFASAELTDPWGTSIELTEGLNRF